MYLNGYYGKGKTGRWGDGVMEVYIVAMVVVTVIGVLMVIGKMVVIMVNINSSSNEDG